MILILSTHPPFAVMLAKDRAPAHESLVHNLIVMREAVRYSKAKRSGKLAIYVFEECV